MLFRRMMIIGIMVCLAACSPVAATQLLDPTETVQLPEASKSVTMPMATIQPSQTIEIPAATLAPTGKLTTNTAEPAPEETIEETPQVIPTFIQQETVESTSIPLPAADASAIQLYSPGPQSKIVSPLAIYGYAIPGFNHKGRVDLFGEDGRLVASEILQLNTSYKWAYFYWEMDFNINSVGELGRLSMSTQDQYGRTTSVYSVHVLLLPEGASIINPPGDDLRERCVVMEPATGQKVKGGMLTVSGTMLPFNELPLTVQLVGRDGIALSSQLVPLPKSDGKPAEFRIDIPYVLSNSTWELLSISQFDDRIGGLMYLYSREIFLNP